MRDDYDTPWKEVLEQYFQEFMAFFFPEAHAEIDWSKGYEFLDKEFQKITKDADTGRRYVDKLVKVFLLNGDETWGLVHTDIQNEPEPGFSERMYIYNYRIFDKYRRPAVSFAVIGHVPKKAQIGKYDRRKWGCEVKFRFPVIRLSAYAKKREQLMKSVNPFAVVVMAHLLAQETAGKTENRLHEKMRIIRHLYRKGFSRQDIINLFRFIDWVMALPEKEDEIFRDEFMNIEKEKKMPYVTSVERIGFKRGVLVGEERGEKRGEERGEKRGKKEGKKEGQISLLAKQIAKKYKSQASKESRVLKKLGMRDIASLGEKLFDFETLDEVHEWIESRLRQKGSADQKT
ncbi:MAG: DUF4351 domain-containing protein [Desulfococcaceae bacterium]